MGQQGGSCRCKKVDTYISDEVKKFRKEIDYILEKNDEIAANLKNASQNENQEAVSKNLEHKLTGKIADVENKIAILKVPKKEIVTKVSEFPTKLEKISGDILDLLELKSNFDSKVNVWDNKADPTEVKKLDLLVNEEVKKIRTDLNSKSKTENQDVISKNLENKLTTNIAQVENKMSIFENSRQEVAKKLSELSSKLEKVDNDFVNLSGMKSTFDSKVDTWNSKADPEEVKKLDKFVKEEVEKMKKDIECIQENNAELSSNLKVTSQHESQEKLSQNLETKLTGNIAQIENKMSIFENSRQDLITKV